MVQACEYESFFLALACTEWHKLHESSLQFQMRIHFFAFLNHNLEEMYWSLEENICCKKTWCMKHFGWKAAIPQGHRII